MSEPANFSMSKQKPERLILFFEGRIVGVNQNALLLLGYKKEQLIGHNADFIFENLPLEPGTHIVTTKLSAGELTSLMVEWVGGGNESLLIWPARQSSENAEGAKSAKSFRSMLRTLHEVELTLGRCESTDELYRQAVVLALNKLEIDRLGVLLYDAHTGVVSGTYGTDEQGNVTCEKDYHDDVPKAPWVQHALNQKDYVVIWDNVDLYHYGKIVGKGWNGMVALWEGDTPIGWIAIDNLINQRPLEPYHQEIIGLFGSALSHLISRKKAEDKLKALNLKLESLVREKTAQLNRKVMELQRTQQELLDSEKMAALGGLVAGVAHEINTPVGTAFTAISYLADLTQDIENKFNGNKLSRSSLQAFLTNSLESTKIAKLGLTRSVDLIQSFKKLALDQSHDQLGLIYLCELLNNIVLTFSHEIKKSAAEVEIIVDPQICIQSYPGLLSQVFSNLLANSLLHGFETKLDGKVLIKASQIGEAVQLNYLDNGCGAQEPDLARLFEPFVTTKRNTGGSGLGLNIVYNIVTQKLAGKIQIFHNKPSGLGFDICLPLELNENL